MWSLSSKYENLSETGSSIVAEIELIHFTNINSSVITHSLKRNQFNEAWQIVNTSINILHWDCQFANGYLPGFVSDENEA